jgi:hypothetical protein
MKSVPNTMYRADKQFGCDLILLAPLQQGAQDCV